MKKADRLAALSELGKQWRIAPNLESTLIRAEQQNPFFLQAYQRKALEAFDPWFEIRNLETWTHDLPDPERPATVGLLLAGNIPMVGWHDLLAVFAAGHKAAYKPSSSDSVLIGFFIDLLVSLAPEAAGYFQKVERLHGIDALIATGSKATVTQFDYYFRSIPRLIRGSRSSLGVLYGFETPAELAPLADDIFLYFGMGCRNVTKILVPEGYDFDPLFQAIEKYRFVTDHHKYQNNGIYHKAIFLMNGDPFLENDLLIVREQDSLFSPVSVLHYQTYRDQADARQQVEKHRDELQCLVSHEGQFPGSIPFGRAQFPSLWDFADGVNSLDFLRNLSEKSSAAGVPLA